MPTVPRSTGQQVQRAATPGVRVSTDAPAEAFGGGRAAAGFAQATQQVSNQIFEIAREEKRKADDVATQESWVKLNKIKNNLLYDPENGALARRGKDALGVSEDYGSRFDQEANEIENGLTSEDQKAMFRRMREKERLELDTHLGRHTFGEIQRHDDETTKATVSAARDEAVLNYKDDELRQRHLALQESTLLAHADRMGMSPEQTKLLLLTEKSKTHTAVVSRMLANGDDLDASAYFNANKDSFSGEDSVALEKALEEGSLRGESQRRSDEIMKRFGGSLSSAVEAVKKIEDPKLRDATLNQVKEMFSLKRAAEDESDKNRYERAFNFADQNGKRPDPVTWSALKPEYKKSIDAWLQSKAQGTRIATDWKVYTDLKTQAASPDLRDKFLKTNMLEYRHLLGDSEYKELVNAQAGLRSGDGKTEKELDGFMSDKDIYLSVLPKSLEKNEDAKALYLRKAQAEQRAFEQRLGRKASSKEVQEIADRLMVEGITKRGWIWDDKKHSFEVSDGENFEIEPKDVPSAERAKIEAALKKRNIPVTNDRIVELYRRKVRGPGAN